MVKEISSKPTENKDLESSNQFIDEDNNLVLQHPTSPKTKWDLKKEKKALKEKLIFDRKTVIREIIQSAVDNLHNKENQLKPAIEIARKAIEDKIFTQRQMRGRMEEAMDSIGVKIRTSWKSISKEEFLNEIDKPVKESRDAFLTGGILITPTRVHKGEVRKDQTPNFQHAYKRGVLRGFRDLETEYIGEKVRIEQKCDREKFETDSNDKKEKLETQKNHDIENLFEQYSKNYNELFHKATAVFKIYKDKQLRRIIKKGNENRGTVINHKPSGTFYNKRD